MKLRAAFKKRLKEAVIRCKRKEFPDCVVKAYPHREEYICVRLLFAMVQSL
jgi:hypothetical protein